ncbi:bifunctional oligoribonuclease/PAP phosphatase NrnA [Candidatus Omnitrophota bacterium]
MEHKPDKLLNLLIGKSPIYIQTHDFPDPDAIAAAFGLQFYLEKSNISSTIIYEGELQTNPVERMVDDLGIAMRRIDDIDLKKDDSVIIVDGCSGNENVTIRNGTIVAVIDHHEGAHPDDVPFVDIRSDYGSTSTIVTLYMRERKIAVIPRVATALAAGIHVDTGSFKRRIHQKDIESFSLLFTTIDHTLLNSILKNTLFQKELIVYEKALKGITVDQKFAFYYYPEDCPRNLLGMLSDFILSVEEIELVVLCSRSGKKVIFSVHSENPAWNAASIIKKALRGLGSGGGHKEMAGGAIQDIALFKEDQVYERFKEQLA